MPTTTRDDLLYPGEATDFFARRKFPLFDPTTGAYNAGNALWLAELSRLVYREPPIPLPPGNNLPASVTYIRHSFIVSKATDTQAMLIEFGGISPFAVLAFRGTEQKPQDLITDLEIGLHTLGKNKVEIHEGFTEALDSVWFKIEKELDALKCPVYFTGHSLGAALATLAVARRLPQNPPKAVYTFGSPRVGNSVFVATLSSIANTIHRVVDDEDIVATLPPIGLGFAHVGIAKILSSPVGGGPFSLGGLFKLPEFLADHAPINYVDRV
jgi:hypothetical protein